MSVDYKSAIDEVNFEIKGSRLVRIRVTKSIGVLERDYGCIKVAFEAFLDLGTFTLHIL